MRLVIFLFSLIFLYMLLPTSAYAQMMGSHPYPSASVSDSDIASQQQEEQEGKNILNQIQGKL